MTPKLYTVGEAVRLRVCSSERFKAGMLSVSSVLPIDKKSACLAPLLLSVLRRGTEKYPTLAEINRRLDYLWGTGFSIRSFYRGNLHVLGFAADLLDKSYLPNASEDILEAVLELMREMLFHPLLDEDGLLSARYVESEKELQCDTIRSVKNNPRSYASERCRALLFEGEPYGLTPYGTEEQTMAVTREELTDFWRRWIADFRPDCFYVGPANPSEVCKKLERAFADCTAGAAAEANGLCSTRKGRGLRAEETLPVSQSWLMVGLRGGARLDGEGYAACVVMNEMLGNSPISRLFVHVRERLSLCYSCSSAYNAHAGTVTVACGINRKNRKRAEREIFRQLDALASGDFRPEELEAAKKALENAYRQVEDSPGGLESFYYGRALMGDPSTLEDCRRRFAEVTAEDVMRAAGALSADVVYFLEGTLADGEVVEDDDGMEI